VEKGWKSYKAMSHLKVVEKSWQSYKARPKNPISRNAVINTGVHHLFFGSFEDSRQKRCTHTRETFFCLKIYLSKNHAKTYIFLDKTYNNLIFVYISNC
jgi:hypothetical protein